jgi:tetratricopeptide (TPR) repeat protein
MRNATRMSNGAGEQGQSKRRALVSLRRSTTRLSSSKSGRGEKRAIGLGCVLALALVAGCSEGPSLAERQQLHAGYASLNNRDYEAAMTAAEKFLRTHPPGAPGSAEALYLQGRVYEQRATNDERAGSDTGSKFDLQSARAAYVKALSIPTDARLVALIHAGVANVAYFQEDYSTAMNEWAVAFPDLSDPEAKAWALYRIGVCQQRLGRFEQADNSFNSVRRQFPGSVPSERASLHLGARAFYVQVGAFTDVVNADKIAASLASQGFHAARAIGPAGQTEVRVGPAYTYADARQLQARLLASYPTATIEP